MSVRQPRAVAAFFVVVLLMLAVAATQSRRVFNASRNEATAVATLNDAVADCQQVRQSLALATQAALANVARPNIAEGRKYAAQKLALVNTTGRLANQLQGYPGLADRSLQLQQQVNKLLATMDPLASPNPLAVPTDHLGPEWQAGLEASSGQLQWDAAALQTRVRAQLNAGVDAFAGHAVRQLAMLFWGMLAMLVAMLGGACFAVANALRGARAHAAHDHAVALNRAVLRSSPQMVLTCDAEGQVTSLNPAAEALLGEQLPVVLGRNNKLHDFLVAGEFVRLARAVLRTTALAANEPHMADSQAVEAFASVLQATPLLQLPQMALQFRRADGTTFAAMATVAPLQAADGTAIGLCLMAADYADHTPALVPANSAFTLEQQQHIRHLESQCRDLLDRTRTLARRETFLHAQLVSSQVLASGGSIAGTLPMLLESLGATLGWQIADCWLVDDATQTIRREALWTTPDKDHESLGLQVDMLRRGEGLAGSIWRDQSSLWIARLATCQAMQGTLTTAALRCGWGVPVYSGGVTVGSLQFYSHETMEEDAELMATVQAVAAQLGEFLSQLRRAQVLTPAAQQMAQQQRILATVAEGVVALAADGKAVFANQAAATLFDSPPSELLRQDIHAMLHRDRPGGMQACAGQCTIAAAIAKIQSSPVQDSTETVHGEETLYRKDGSSVPVEFSIARGRQPASQAAQSAAIVCSLRDISQRCAVDRLKDEFVSTVSHELRTPLTSIRGALGLLSTGLLGNVPEKGQKLLQIAVSNTDRLVRLINDVLDLERMESGRAVLQFRPLDVGDLIQQAVETMRPMAEAAGVQINCNADRCECEADADRLMQVFTNLLSNAVKFSSSGSHIHIHVSAGSEILSIAVADQGRGVPQDKLESIFDRFQQVDATDSRQKGGTGLGLAICRSILQQHGGRIWAERNTPQGSVFRIVVPRSQTRASQPGMTHQPMLAAEPAIPLPLLERTVLVCDDDAITRTMVRHYLQHHNYRVIEAESGEHALRLARQHALDAILLDLFMPGMDGWETLHQLKQDAATATVPVVILSVFASRTMKNGEDVRGWISKPFNEQTLLAALHTALHGNPHGLVAEHAGPQHADADAMQIPLPEAFTPASLI